MREVDRLTTEKYGIPSILLMENAAHAAARAIAEKLGGSVQGKSFLILCGKGNNGGDGAALARILWTQGADVYVYLFGKIEDTKGDARVNFEILKNIEELRSGFKPGVFIITANTPKIESNHFSFEEIRLTEKTDVHTEYLGFIEFDYLVDALYGTGLTRPLGGEYQKLFDELEKLIGWSDKNPKVLAIDIPSGLNADQGLEIGANMKADLTVTFTAPKLANVLPPASNFNGELVVAHIGSPLELVDKSQSRIFLTEIEDAADWLKKTNFTSASYKNKRGHALLVAGAEDFAGAAVLAGNAAIVSGVGLVTVATPESSQNAIASRMLPEVMTRGVAETKKGAAAESAFEEIDKFIEKSIDALAVGSGLSSNEESTKKLVEKLVEKRRTPVVIDADGLTALAPFGLEGSDELPLILTPHEGEFLRLLGTKDKESIKDRVAVAREFAQKHHVILVLKGERTLCAAPDGRVVINPTGNSGLGKAGNGDTLAGIIVGFAAQAAQMKIDMFETTVAAVYLAGLAGDIAAEKFGKRSMLASDVRACLRDAFERIRN